MNINFDEIEEQRMPEFKGGTGAVVARMYFDGTLRALKGYLEAGSSIGMHKHEGNSESMYFFKGEGKIICDGEETSIGEGSFHFCPDGHTHSLINTGDEPLYFLFVIA